jgi:cytochrome c peroxidase
MKKIYFLFYCILGLTLASFFEKFDFFEKYQPKHFPKPVYNFKKNPLSAAKIHLGRVLFYDPILSRDGTISCASCHSPYNAFAHSDHALSHGIDDQIGTRNAPALQNLAWQPYFMYDGAVNHLDMQSLFPITHPKEMDETMANVVLKLNQNKAYKKAFYKAYKDSTATGERVLKSLSQFMLTLVSATAKYDSVQQQRAKFTKQEKNGYQLFKKNCAACHTEPLFSSFAFANNGLPIDSFLKDFGRMSITKNKKDSLFFKIPSLRNIQYSAPYMHDGRFKRLQNVLTHYTSDFAKNAQNTPQITLTSNEKVDLIAFLHTLSDRHFLMDTTHTYRKY